MVVIDNLDVLRGWLIRKLTPMCDADPAALAKYVVALVKKDKSEEDLKALCNNQLEVFLQNETPGFVASLFETLSNKSYLDSHPDSTTTNSSTVSQAVKMEEVKKESRKRIQRPSPIRHRSRSPYDRRRRREDVRFRRARSPNYERRDRRYRSRSPSPRKRLSPRKRSPVRRSRSRSPFSRRSPRRRRTRSLSSSRSSSDPLSRSPDSTHPKQVATSTDESKKKTRCWDYDQKGLCLLGESCPYDHGTDPVVVDESAISSSARPPTTAAVVPPPSIPPPLIVPPPTSIAIAPSHPPPMIPRFLPPPPIGFPILPPGLRQPAPPIIPPPVPPPIQNIRIPPPVHHPPPGYNPEAPGLNYKQRRMNLTNLVPISANRIRPPSEFTTGRKRIGDIENDGDENGPPVIKRTIYTNNSSAPQTMVLQNNSNYSVNTKLVIRKIPPLLNNITKLNEHFSKFGAINNIQVRYDNDPGSALIEFAHVDSAREARMDTAAILDNRFITVNWYSPSNSNSASAQQKRIPVKERLGILPAPSQLKYTAPGVNVTSWKETMATSSTIFRTISNPGAEAQTAPPVAKVQTVTEPQSQENEETKAKVQMAKQAAKEKLLAHQKIVMQKNVEIQKQKQDLLQKQIQQQKLLLNKVESNKTMPTSEKLDLLKTLRDVTASIDKLRTSLKSGGTANTTAIREKKNRTQKELLDAELDLYNASSTGENTIILKRKLNQLKVEASSLGLVSSFRGGWGAGRGRGRGRGSHMTYVARQKQPRVFSSSANLDRRPRELRITGFHDDEKDELVSHLSRFGEIQNFTFSDDDITCTVKFQTRLQAENAALQAPSFKNRQLVIVWNCPPATPARLDPPPVPASVLDAPEEDRPAGDTEHPPLVVGEDDNGNKDQEEDDEDDVGVVVHIGDVIAEHPDSGLPEEEEEEYGEEEEELDEDALLAADYDEDDDHTADDDYEEEIRSWRH